MTIIHENIDAQSGSCGQFLGSLHANDSLTRQSRCVMNTRATETTSNGASLIELNTRKRSAVGDQITHMRRTNGELLHNTTLPRAIGHNVLSTSACYRPGEILSPAKKMMCQQYTRVIRHGRDILRWDKDIHRTKYIVQEFC